MKVSRFVERHYLAVDYRLVREPRRRVRAMQGSGRFTLRGEPFGASRPVLRGTPLLCAQIFRSGMIVLLGVALEGGRPWLTTTDLRNVTYWWILLVLPQAFL